jgi:hypothetical protein
MFLPSHVAVESVDADVQNLGIALGELREIAIERRQLLASSRSPVDGVERYDHILLAAKIAQADSDPLLSFDRG